MFTVVIPMLSVSTQTVAINVNVLMVLLVMDHSVMMLTNVPLIQPMIASNILSVPTLMVPISVPVSQDMALL